MTTEPYSLLPTPTHHSPLFKSFTVQRKFRLRTNAEFQHVRRKGKSVANRWLVLLWVPNKLSQSRFGFAVGKKLGKAVKRNKIKRRLREHLRLQLQADHLRPGYDVVVIARQAACQANYHTLAQALDQLLRRARLWK